MAVGDVVAHHQVLARADLERLVLLQAELAVVLAPVVDVAPDREVPGPERHVARAERDPVVGPIGHRHRVPVGVLVLVERGDEDVLRPLAVVHADDRDAVEDRQVELEPFALRQLDVLDVDLGRRLPVLAPGL